MFKLKRFRVVGKPEIPIGPLQVQNITATACQLDWKPPVSNNDIPVNHYAVYKRTILSADWGNAIAKLTKTSYVVDNLEPATDYHFKVVAVNEWGESDALETLKSIRTRSKYKGNAVRFTYLKTAYKVVM